MRIAGNEPLYRSYLSNSLRDDFARHTPVAQELIERTTGLGGGAGDATGRVISREDWIDANLASFRRLLSPVIDKAARRAHEHSEAKRAQRNGQPEPSAGTLGEAFESTAVRIASKVGAAELGLVMGWMSHRVLGQYDMLWASDADSTVGDVVYYVGPNILATEKRFAFPPTEFRLWLALHELTHRSQFTGVPWLRDHFLTMLNGLIDVADPDPERIRQGIKRFFEERRSGRDPLTDGGLPAIFATPEQRSLIEQVGGLMSLVEGHGDVAMSRAAVGHVPSADRFHSVLHHRRSSATGISRLWQKLLGIEAKLAQYSAGEQFIEHIERHRGERAVDQIWETPDHLPTLAEIRKPQDWLERVPEPSVSAASNGLPD